MAAVESTQATKKPQRTSFLDKINRAINGRLERVFEALGRLIGARPLVVIILSTVIALAIGSGVVRIKNETRGEKLWVPDDNESQRNNEFVNKYFPSLARIQLVYLEREDGGDILTPEAFDKALEIHNRILALQWNNTEAGEPIVPYLPATQNITDLCFNERGEKGADTPDDCVITTPMMLFGYNASNWETRAALLDTLSDPGSWDKRYTRSGFVLDGVLGSLQQQPGGDVTGAKVLSLSYLLASNKTLVDAQEEDEPAGGWEGEFLNLMEALDVEDDVWTVNRFSERSFDDEFGDTISSDLLLLQVAIVAVFIYTYIAISDWQDGIVGSRLLLTIGGILNIGLAVVTAYGLAGYIGLLFTPLMSILPFIMLGVGVDGMFVLQAALDATDPNESMQTRMAETMRQGGVSVAVASVTNFGAFMIGSNTSLPALSAFSIYAALGLLFDLLLQITFFSAIMCIDKRRQEKRRMDIAVCASSTAPERAGYCCGLFGKPPYKQGYRTRAMTWLGTQYTKRPFKVVVIAMWLGVLTAGIYGTSQMRVDADVNDFIPEGSYLRDWFAVLRDNFGASGTNVNLYFVNDRAGGDPVDFAAPQVQQQMDDALELFRGNEFVVAGTMSSWWEGLKDFNNGTAPAASFYPSLSRFLFTPTGGGARFLGDIAFVDPEDPTSEIFAARSSFSWPYLEDTNEQIRALDSMRDTTAQIPAPLGTRAFTHANDYLNIEQYKSIGREAVMNIGLGFLMIGIVILLLVANPLAALLTFLSVASAIIELVGFMYYRGTYIDSVSVIFLVISLGLAVDYSVHVAHGYLSTDEADSVLRMQKTMAQTGVAVVNGAVSTLIAALCLAGSGSYVFITFFYALLFIVLCGAFQGLVVLPVLLDIFQPAPHAPALDDASGWKAARAASVGEGAVAAPPNNAAAANESAPVATVLAPSP